MAKKRKWLIPALVGVAVLGIGGYAYATKTKSKETKKKKNGRATKPGTSPGDVGLSPLRALLADLGETQSAPDAPSPDIPGIHTERHGTYVIRVYPTADGDWRWYVSSDVAHADEPPSMGVASTKVAAIEAAIAAGPGDPSGPEGQFFPGVDPGPPQAWSVWGNKAYYEGEWRVLPTQVQGRASCALIVATAGTALANVNTRFRCLAHDKGLHKTG